MNKNKAKQIEELFIEKYKDAVCTLDYTTDIEFLVASRLSAQCTDARVNIVTRNLFLKYKTVDDYANADITELETLIKSCGFYHGKAKSIIELSQQLIKNHNSKIPSELEQLLALSGIGRKIANLVMGELFNKEAYVADTHCIRLSNRLGFVKSDVPKKVEDALRKYITKENSLKFCHAAVSHGREVCKARNPDCRGCFVFDLCEFKGIAI